MAIDDASEDGRKTGAGDKHCGALHICATSWYCAPVQGGGPFV